jgi:hypothetical protein
VEFKFFQEDYPSEEILTRLQHASNSEVKESESNKPTSRTTSASSKGEGEFLEASPALQEEERSTTPQFVASKDYRRRSGDTAGSSKSDTDVFFIDGGKNLSSKNE